MGTAEVKWRRRNKECRNRNESNLAIHWSSEPPCWVLVHNFQGTSAISMPLDPPTFLLASRSNSGYVNLQTKKQAEETWDEEKQEEEEEERGAIHSQFNIHSHSRNDPFESQRRLYEYLEEEEKKISPRPTCRIHNSFWDHYKWSNRKDSEFWQRFRSTPRDVHVVTFNGKVKPNGSVSGWRKEHSVVLFAADFYPDNLIVTLQTEYVEWNYPIAIRRGGEGCWRGKMARVRRPNVYG